MAYIGQGLDRFSNVEKLDAITPATATGAGPYNLTKGGVAFTPSSADTMVVSIELVKVRCGKGDHWHLLNNLFLLTSVFFAGSTTTRSAQYPSRKYPRSCT